jgi:DNA-binding MarR family transcriptional regulator
MLTDKGKKVVDADVTEHVANEERLLSSLTSQERESLINCSARSWKR